MVITTNYDHNLKYSGVKNVYHAHGSVDDIDSIEVATFKKYRTILNNIKAKISAEEKNIIIDIFGLSLYNEVHILNILFNLRMEYKNKLQVNQYIYSKTDADFENQELSHLFLNYFYQLKWNDKPKFIDSNNDAYNNWVLEKIDQTNDVSQHETYLLDKLIKMYLYKTNPNPKNEDIEIFKFIFNFCKSIKILSHSEHFINNFYTEFSSPTIEVDINKILDNEDIEDIEDIEDM